MINLSTKSHYISMKLCYETCYVMKNTLQNVAKATLWQSNGSSLLN